jgi:hypothetical protein
MTIDEKIAEIRRVRRAKAQREWARLNKEKAKSAQDSWNKKNRNEYQRMYRLKKKQEAEKGNDAPKKYKHIMLRVDEQMYLEIRKGALLQRTTVSEYIRGRIVKRYNKPFPIPKYDREDKIEKELKEKYDILFTEEYRRGVNENWGSRPIAAYEALHKILRPNG